jgi:hypothetical protein
MNWGKDEEMWSMEAYEHIRRETNKIGHRFDCECQVCRRTKILERLIQESKR